MITIIIALLVIQYAPIILLAYALIMFLIGIIKG